MKTKIIFIFTIIFTLSFSAIYAQGCEDDAGTSATNSGVLVAQHFLDIFNQNMIHILQMIKQVLLNLKELVLEFEVE
jgi:hypothetical protein